ncbi:MAG: DUF2167 domain-containing protein [Chromatiales bacterium]|nr:DUF2167 domain-containing protein [Chromatiales bacterium]
MNFIADMKQRPDIKNNISPVLALAQFSPGNQYHEFDPDLDEIAAYGIGGLVAGKLLAKAGLLAVLLVFLKKFWIIGRVAAYGVFKFLKRKASGAADTAP